MSITRPICRPIASPLSRPLTAGGVGGGFPGSLIAAGDDGFAVDFVSARAVVQDSATPANSFLGAVGDKLVITGSMPADPDGAVFSDSNFARILESLWPYNNTQITIAGEIKFDTASDAALRSVFQLDPGGNDRLQVCSLAGSDGLTLSAGLGASAVNLTADNVISADTWLRFVVVAGPAGMFIVVNSTERASNSLALVASASPTRFHGIGANTDSTGDAINLNPMKGAIRKLIAISRPVSKEVAKAGWPFKLSIVALGDSLTHGVVADVTQDEAYPALLAKRIPRFANVINSGVQGDSTAEMMNRRAALVADGTPDIVILYGGTNDVSTAGTVQASPVPTSTVFAIEAGKGSYYKADGWITVGGEQAQILSVVGDTITLTAALSGGVPAAGTEVAIDTEKNLTEIALYAQSMGCQKILIAGNHYWNWTSGGDTVDTELTRNATLRSKQQAAATAAGAVYVDLYGWMRQLIVSGAYTQGDNGWHSSENNQHLNEVGQAILADAFQSAIASQGWA